MSVVSSLGKIQVLPAEVVSRIAAGEVIDRPASVVKELLDNSLDAGSTRITVDITDGGRTLIRVTDNGEGMTAADAPLAFQRHATSKLRSENDLWRVRTLGFRGEALPSIASVARVRLITACRNEPVGVRVVLAGGTLIQCDEVAAPPGTQIEVEELFFNTPARRKFLKSPSTEFSHICQVVQQAALAWPGTQFRLTHNGHVVMDYPAVSSRRDRIVQVYGLRFAEQAESLVLEHASLKVEGLTVRPTHLRTGRTPQDLFVNRRPVRNAPLTQAVYAAYGEYLSKGQHPQFVLFLEVDPERVDVNVHPMKREVRFADQDTVFQAVRSAVRAAIGATAKRALVSSPAQWSPQPLVAQETRPEAEQQQALSVQETVAPYGCDLAYDVLPLGQLRATYLVAQVGSELQVIDQHTAHERVLFERLCRSGLNRPMPCQPLLLPETIEVPLAQAAVLVRHVPDLEEAGLVLEPFGTGTFVVRAVPAILPPVDYRALVLDLADELSQWSTGLSLEMRLRSVMASLACHGAVRAGRILGVPEIKRLIEDWVSEGLPATCPHGRRVALRLSEDELARIFGRA